ncbi:MAG TPA: Fic family protein [Phycisphaerales bacterium]|nr:Fic family protein [Phycisphaerales bacterium]
MADLMAAQQAMLRLEGFARALPSPTTFFGPARRREVIYSSKIENTFATAREVALVETTQKGARGDALDVFASQRAFEHGVGSPLPMCLRLMREMHAELMKFSDPRKTSPGEWRDIQVCIGDERRGLAEARFVPPPPGEHLAACLGALEDFLRPPGASARPRGELLVEIAMVHYQFECIHPFKDGNGRLGRLLICLWGYKIGALEFPLPFISRYLERRREEYYNLLLRVSTHGDWTEWIRFFCHAVAAECAADLHRAQALAAYRQRMVDGVTAKRTSVLTLRLIDLLFEKPAVTVSEATRRLGVTPPSAQAHIDKLAEAGFVREATGSEYGRVWLAEELLTMIDSDELPLPGTGGTEP